MGAARPEGGGRWRRIGSLGPDHPVFSVTIAPQDGRTVLAWTFGALYHGARTAHGWAWQRVARTGEAAVTAIAWTPWAARLAFASVFAAGPSVLVSHDAGRTWRPDGAGPPPALPTDALLAVAMAYAMLVAIGLVYPILVIVFRSLLVPFVIVSALECAKAPPTLVCECTGRPCAGATHLAGDPASGDPRRGREDETRHDPHRRHHR